MMNPGTEPVDRGQHRGLDAHLDALPHGPSFRFVDSLVAVEPGSAARGRYRLRGDEAFLAGHFPGRPMMPGVLMIEAVAQLAGVAAQSDASQVPLRDVRLAAVRAAKVRDTATPGEELAIEARVDGRMGGMVQASGSVSATGVDGRERLLLTCSVTLAGEPG